MFRIGIGYDIHRLEKKRKLVLGGVEIPYPKGLLGHSDADVLLHAISDALLGAAGESDIGEIFPDDDKRFKDISSLKILKNVYDRLLKKKAKIINIDSVVIIENPKIAPHKKQMRKNIAKILKIDISSINIKAKTEEGLGKIGRSQAVAVYASAMVDVRLKR